MAKKAKQVKRDKQTKPIKKKDYSKGDDLLDIPSFLLRKNWTKEQIKENEEMWSRIARENRELQYKQQKEKEEQDKKLQQRILVTTEISQGSSTVPVKKSKNTETADQMELVFKSMERGNSSIDEIFSDTKLPMRRLVRRALKRLAKSGKIEKIGRGSYRLKGTHVVKPVEAKKAKLQSLFEKVVTSSKKRAKPLTKKEREVLARVSSKNKGKKKKGGKKK